jgi:hypothetical protein
VTAITVSSAECELTINGERIDFDGELTISDGFQRTCELLLVSHRRAMKLMHVSWQILIYRLLSTERRLKGKSLCGADRRRVMRLERRLSKLRRQRHAEASQ